MARIWIETRRGRRALCLRRYNPERLVFDLYYRSARLAANGQSDPTERNYSYFRAVQTARGAAIELCVWLLFWESRYPTGRIGKAPRDALSLAPEVRAIFETELQDTTQSGWISGAILARYLTWLSFFGRDRLRLQVANLFPASNKDLRDMAWLAHLQNDQAPVAELVDALRPRYLEHIRSLGHANAPRECKESNNRLVEYLIILYLWDRLPEDLLQLILGASSGGGASTCNVVYRAAYGFDERSSSTSNVLLGSRTSDRSPGR